MARKNIFSAETLSLDYFENGDYFILIRNNNTEAENKLRKKYTSKQAQDLIMTITRQVTKNLGRPKPENYNLKEYLTTPKAKRKLKSYLPKQLESIISTDN